MNQDSAIAKQVRSATIDAQNLRRAYSSTQGNYKGFVRIGLIGLMSQEKYGRRLNSKFSTLAEIQAAVRAGRRVHWKNEGYTVGCWVHKDGSEQWSVVFHTGDSVGLSPSEHRAADFFFGE